MLLEVKTIRVLLVEDDEDDAALVRELLGEIPLAKYELEWVATHQAGIARLCHSEYDVCLLDYYLNGVDGLDLLLALERSGCRVPVIILTGKGSHETDLAAMRAGAMDYLEKGAITPDLLERAIRYAIQRRQTEEILRASEVRFRGTFENAAMGMTHIDLNGNWLRVNPKFCELLGYTREELEGKKYWDLTYPGDIERDVACYAQMTQGKLDYYDLEKRYITKDGRLIWVFVSRSLQRDSKGKPIYTITNVMDITERKRAEANIAMLARFPDENPNPVMRLDHNHRLIYSNNASRLLLRAWGIQAGQRVPEEVRAAAETAWTRNENIEMEVEAEGQTFSLFFTPIADQGYLNVYGRDITGSKQAAMALRDSEERFRTLADSLPQLAWIARADGYIVWYNRRWYEYTGATPEQMEGWGWQSVHDPDVLPRVLEEWMGSIATGEPFSMVFPLRGADGRFRLFLTRVMPLRDAQGQVVQWFGTNTDVDELKRTEEALLESERRYRDMLSNVELISLILDREERITFCNDYLLRLTGWQREEVVGANWFERFIPPESPEVKGTCRALFENLPSAWHHENEILTRSGERRLIRWNNTVLYSTSGEVIGTASIGEDITDHRRAEEALRVSERRYSALFANKINGIAHCQIITDERGKPVDYWVLQVNEAYEHITGIKKEEIEGRRATEVFPGIEHYRFDYIGTYGRIALEGGEIMFEEYFEGTEQYLSIYSYSPLPGEFTAIFTDVTGRKRAENALRDAIDQLAQADRRKDEFLAMLAHELRNPLAPIRYAVQMLNMNGLAQAALQKQREVIDRQVSHMGRLLDDLLDISRITRGKITLKREIVDLRAVATQALDSMRPMIEGRGQHLLYEGPSSPLLVDGDPTRLEQIIRNILHNANKYTETGGCIKLTLGLENDPEHGCRTVVRVSDSGIGIDPDMLPYVFEAFVQAEQGLARSQGGLGIGLAMVRNLVELHGGRVEAHSAGPGHGSEFTVRLPVAESVEARRPEQHPTGRQTQSSPCRVLVVDDNEDSAASLGELLNLWGHEVRTAYDGPHALATAAEWRPEVILLDIGLPGMDGYQVAGRLRQEPGTQEAVIVALTGYGAEEDRRRAQEAGFDHHLTKPVEMERLQAVLSRCHAA